MKRCTRCGAEKPLADFGARRRLGCRTTLLSRCRCCMRELAAEWRERNPERVRAANKEYYAKNREAELERNRRKQRDWTPKNHRRRTGAPVSWSKQQVVSTYGSVCHLCGEVIDMRLKWPNRWSLTMDHVLPISRGGSNDLENIRPAHGSCNSAKRDRLVVR